MRKQGGDDAMIKTMLVEDEKIILEDLLTIIDWKAEGFEVVATARNGRQGLSFFEQYVPELIITDIRMPVMDGLAMLKSIKHIKPSVRFLILSAYNDFEYAKTALRLGAQDYILKTEISARYLHEKLSAIKISMNEETELLYAAAEKRLTDFIASPPTASAEALNKIIAPLAALQLPAALPHILNFIVPAIQKHYDDMNIPDKFSLPEIYEFSGLTQWLLEELQTITCLGEQIFVRHYSPAIINAIEFIRRNYPDPDLKINTIADHVGLSAGRLSTLFKKEIGKTVNDCITETRIDAAKKCLSSGKYKVYEVSEQVGYKTSQYFSQVFYQYTGQYPNQYRRGLE